MTTINIKGTIISNDDKMFYNWFNMDSTCPRDIELPSDNSDITVEINSPGGDVFAGAEIYTALKAYSGNIHVKIVGFAASAASFIAMAGDKISISPMGTMLIHNVSMRGNGDQNEHEKMANVLAGMSDQIAESYSARTGKPVENFKKLMDVETWFTAKQAVEEGLADEIMFEDENEVEFVAGFGMLSPEAKEKARNALLNATRQEPVAEVTVDTSEIVRIVRNELENIKNEQKECPSNEKTFLF